MDRRAPFIAFAHNPRALLVYDVIWLAALAAAVPFVLRLRQAARAIDRRKPSRPWHRTAHPAGARERFAFRRRYVVPVQRFARERSRPVTRCHKLAPDLGTERHRAMRTFEVRNQPVGIRCFQEKEPTVS
jgi:hypothetical protein